MVDQQLGYGGDDSTYNPRRTPPPESALALARANLTQAKQGLCSHGVPARNCTDAHEKETA